MVTSRGYLNSKLQQYEKAFQAFQKSAEACPVSSVGAVRVGARAHKRKAIREIAVRDMKRFHEQKTYGQSIWGFSLVRREMGSKGKIFAGGFLPGGETSVPAAIAGRYEKVRRCTKADGAFAVGKSRGQ